MGLSQKRVMGILARKHNESCEKREYEACPDCNITPPFGLKSAQLQLSPLP